MSPINVSTRSKSVLTVLIVTGLVILAALIFATTAYGAAKFITTPIGYAPPVEDLPITHGMPRMTWKVARIDPKLVHAIRTPPRPVVRALSVPTRLPDPSPASGSDISLGQAMAAKRGWTGGQWAALRQLWSEESGWKTSATNPTSGACGIPQRHPCNGLSSLSAEKQIAWGLDYIAGRYGTPSAALAHKHARGWY